ncbi:MAG: 23S rRNA (cytosine1962-C5)-methyltransferase [Granulosicoccus sp.]|jgi:23S rRNA (cytosine1962-C5)-methyltransferase
MDSNITINWQELIRVAWEKRKPLWQDSSIDCFRVFHGYEEGSKGTVIEKFNDAAVIDYKTDIRGDLPDLTQALLKVFPFKNIIAKGHQSLGFSLKERTDILRGKDTDVTCDEHELKFRVKLDATHNSGLYLDARDARNWLVNNSSNRRILNLFAFTGSLGLSSAYGKATEVIHLDRSKELLPRIQENYQINNVKFEARNFLRGDVYKHLPRAIKAGQKFDGIILDPPPKIYQSPYAKHKTNGQDFSALIQYCTELLNPGGWILGMLHRFDFSWDDFEDQVMEASGRLLLPQSRLTSGIDFPESMPDKKLRVSIFCAQNEVAG